MILIIIFFLVFIYLYFFNSYVFMKSNIDNNNYWVQKHNPEQSSDTLASINIKIKTLINYLDQTEKYEIYRKYIDRLKKKYNYSIFYEGVYDPNYTSYNINKEKIVLCLRQKPDESIVKENTLMYVILHELSHFIADDTVLTDLEHKNNKEFNILFNMLLAAAEESKIYNPVNYSTNPEPYCGINIK